MYTVNTVIYCISMYLGKVLHTLELTLLIKIYPQVYIQASNITIVINNCKLGLDLK